MNIDGKPYRTIWLNPDGWSVEIIDQTKLPLLFETVNLKSLEDASARDRHHAGARCAADRGDRGLWRGAGAPRRCLRRGPRPRRRDACRDAAHGNQSALGARRDREGGAQPAARGQGGRGVAKAAEICDDDVETSRKIGEHGLGLIQAHADKKGGERVNILTHCNAGWLATVDWGTALAPIYRAYDEGLHIHVWVDETRPRNQGASLTAFELGAHGVPHTIIADNAGGHLMQNKLVDLCIVGTDRTTAHRRCRQQDRHLSQGPGRARQRRPVLRGAARHSTIDWTLSDGSTIPIEERDAREVTHVTGRLPDGSIATVDIAPTGSPAANYAFDVTPLRFVTGFITERGVTPGTRDGLAVLYPEHAETKT